MIFNDTKIAFQHLSNRQVLMAYWLFLLLSSRRLQKVIVPTIQFFGKVHLSFNFIISPLYNQFFGGKKLDDTIQNIRNTAKRHVFTILHYGVEFKKTETEFDYSLKKILESIEFAHEHLRVKIISCKVTGLGQAKILEKIQNKETLIENGDTYIIGKIPTVQASQNKETFRAKLVVDGEKLKGTCKRTYLGESRTEFQNIYNSFETDKKAEALERYLSKNDKNNHVTSVKTSDLKSREQALTIDYELESENRLSNFDGEMYLNFEFMNEYKKFTLKDRKTDYELDYKTLYDSEITIVLPAGYKVEKLPENLTQKEEDYQVEVSFSQKGNELLYRKVFIFNIVYDVN